MVVLMVNANQIQAAIQGHYGIGAIVLQHANVMLVKVIVIQMHNAILVIALIMLVLLTLLGISATRTSDTELQIAGNDMLQKMAFYAAESGWQVGIHWLDTRYPPVTAAVEERTAAMPADDAITYAYSASFDGAVHAPGYSTEFRRYMYTVNSAGHSPGNAHARIAVTAGKVFYAGGY